MIGFSSILSWSVALLTVLVFFFGFLPKWTRILFARRRPTGRELAEAAFFLVWTGVLSQLFVHEFLLHRTLGELRPDTVVSIEINGRTLSDRNQIAAITDALNHPQWFAPGHPSPESAWADEVALIINLKTGEVLHYHVARYLQREGAVLISSSTFDPYRAHWNLGQAFYSDLPSVLARAGIALPDCQSRPDGRRCTSCAHPCPARSP